MELTKKQEEGLKIAIERYNNHEKYTCISGYAGSGKSTLVKFLISALDVDPEKEVVYTSYTGKATQVLFKKGNTNVSTLHKLLFKHFLKKDGTYGRKIVPEIPYKIVVVDEVSMVPQSLLDVLFSFNVHVICCGDPFQLPPIKDTKDEGKQSELLQHPHVFLDEIMRQAEESEIIRLSMKIRNFEPIDTFNGNEVQVINKNQMVTGMLTWADQILVAKNVTRTSINMKVREMLGREGGSVAGDKVICNKNYWGILSNETNAPLLNGTIGTIGKDFSKRKIYYPNFITNKGPIEALQFDFISECNEKFDQLSTDYKLLTKEQPSLTSLETYKIAKNKNFHSPLQFYFGYAITCHRSQGSEWDKGLIIEENFPFSREEHARWLYTAVTRFSEKLVLVKGV